MRLTGKQQANLEIEKLSKDGLEFLTLFQRDMKDPAKPIHKVIVATMLHRWPSYASVAAKGWMAAQGASDSDIQCVGRIVQLTGLWGIWPGYLDSK